MSWYSSIYSALIVSSSIAFIIGFVTKGSTSFGATLSAYSILILAIMMILTILFRNILFSSGSQSSLQVFLTIFSVTGPFILMLVVMGVILYLTIGGKDRIIAGQVSPSYYTFSNIAIILFLLQTYTVYQNLNTVNTTGKISPLTASLLYLFGLLSVVCAMILLIVLKYYQTDGFI